jgi:hypothetical protein
MTSPTPQSRTAVHWLCVILGGLTLSACAQTAAEKPAADLTTPPRPLLVWLASQPEDQYAETILDDPEFGTNVTVQAYRTYYSAAGQSCRQIRVRVVVNGPPSETVIACRDASNQWLLAPRISSSRDSRQ